MIQAARFYGMLVPVFPCEPRGKAPLGRLAPHGFKDATTDQRTIAAWWRAEPTANIGVACGPAHLWVIDIDPRHGGDDTIMELQRQHGSLDDTLWARTGSGGWHALYGDTTGLGSSTGRFGTGVDTRGEGGYVLVPPSVHPSGGVYRWWNEGAPIAPLPAWVRRLLEPPAPAPTRTVHVDLTDRYVQAAVEDEVDRVASAAPGTRNDALNASTYSLARLVGEHLSSEQLFAAMMNAARACGLPPAEAARTIRSAISARRAS